MRYKSLVILLIVSLSGCSFRAQILTPEPSASPTDAGTQMFMPLTDAVTLTPSAQAAGTIEPGITEPPPVVFTPTPLSPTVGIHSIQFAPNGTYADILDSIQAGRSKTYSVNAMNGQVMSVAIRQNTDENWTVIPMKIVGADGTVLCPHQENRDCYFWRGVLPSTQDYFITLTPPIDVADFMMRVAIDPPGTRTQEFRYSNIYRTAILTYTDEFAPARFPGATVYKIEPELVLEFIDTQFYESTNLSEAYFLFGSTSDDSIVTGCTQPVSFGGPEQNPEEVNINGIKFIHTNGGGVAAGNIYEQNYYRGVHNNICYEITFFVHYGNIGNYPPDSGVKEFDHAALMQKFEDILSTLVINQ